MTPSEEIRQPSKKTKPAAAAPRAPSPQTFDEWLDQDLVDPEFRSLWYASALGRTFGLAVFKHRMDRDLSQTALSKLAGVSQPMIAQAEEGERTPSLPTILGLCDALGLELSLTIGPKGETRRIVPAKLKRGAICDSTDQIVVSVREAR